MRMVRCAMGVIMLENRRKAEFLEEANVEQLAMVMSSKENAGMIRARQKKR